MTSTESYTAVAGQARQTTEKSVEVWRQGAQTFTDQANVLSGLPSIDLTQPVELYFEFVQRTVDLNRELATGWAELMMSLSGAVREQAEKVGQVVQDQTETIADLATEQAKKTEELARQHAEQAEQVEREQARRARQAEREQARQALEQAREPYQGLTKAELADKLAERELPKTGTVEELIERLVSADSE